jgi:hypothetical protein
MHVVHLTCVCRRYIFSSGVGIILILSQLSSERRWGRNRSILGDKTFPLNRVALLHSTEKHASLRSRIGIPAEDKVFPCEEKLFDQGIPATNCGRHKESQLLDKSEACKTWVIRSSANAPLPPGSPSTLFLFLPPTFFILFLILKNSLRSCNAFLVPLVPSLSSPLVGLHCFRPSKSLECVTLNPPRHLVPSPTPSRSCPVPQTKWNWSLYGWNKLSAGRVT